MCILLTEGVKHGQMHLLEDLYNHFLTELTPSLSGTRSQATIDKYELIPHNCQQWLFGLYH